MSPTPSSLADLSSPDTHDLQVLTTTTRRYPRGIINPNYPGFQHLAHTLAEHFIDHHNHHHQQQQYYYEQQLLSDSECSDEIDFDVLAYRSGNLVNVNIMSDSNNNNNDTAAVAGAHGDDCSRRTEEKIMAIDLNRNKNRQCASSAIRGGVASGDFDMKADDGNVNLLMKSEPKVFCESKQLLEHLVIAVDGGEHSSEDDDEEFCNVSGVEPQQMEFDEDDDEDMADLSGEDDAAIKNELERIDSDGDGGGDDDNDFNENINCDLVTYLQQYDFKMDLEKSYQLDECLTDEDNCKLPTPDILIEHNNSSSSSGGSINNGSNKKLQNDDMTADVISAREGNNCDDETKHSMAMAVAMAAAADVSQDEVRDFQPDLIKNIGDNNHERITGMQHQHGGDNEISPHAEREILHQGYEREKNEVVEEKIINQVQTEMTVASGGSTQLSFDSATSAVVDIIGDFGKEIEKEIGLIVSGYLNGDKLLSSPIAPSSPPQTNEPIRPLTTTTTTTMLSPNKSEVIFDENKFIEHLKYFSKVRSKKHFIYIHLLLHFQIFMLQSSCRFSLF